MLQSVRSDAACMEVERVARWELARHAWCLDEGLLLVEPDVGSLRWRYILESAPRDSTGFDPQELARLDCRLHLDDNLMWIGDLRVSNAHRLRGWGRRLVRTAEGVARGMDCNVVVVYPLVDSMPFWRRLSYHLHPRKARVLQKRLGLEVDRRIAYR